MLRDFLRDTRIAARAFFAQPAFTVVAVLTVALAIGANSVVFAVLRGVVLRPLPYRQPDRLVTVWPNHFLSYRQVLYLREHATTLTEIGAWVPGWSMTLTGSGDAAKLEGARVTPDLFTVLGTAPMRGRSFVPGEEAPGADDVLFLSAGLWRTRFGSDSSVVGGDYFAALGIPLVAGRAPEADDRAGTPAVVVVNQTMARRFWRGDSPLGRRIRAGNATRNEWATVVGLLGDVRHNGLHTDPVPELYQPYAQNPVGGMTVVIRTGTEPRELARAAVEAIWSIDRDIRLTAVRSMAEVAGASVAPRRTVLVLLGAFAGVGLVLGIAGVFGVVSHHVAARTREIGIRIALGAEPRSVVGASRAQGVRLAAVGVMIGLGGAVLVGRWLQAFVFHVTTRDPVTLGVVAVLLLGITALASYLPARRAAGIDPVTALRAE